MHQWGFKPFITNVDYAHRVLSEYGEPVTKGRNVSNFLRGIQGPRMSHTKCAVVSNPTMMVSFTLATDYLEHFIESRSIWFVSYLITNDNVGKGGGGKVRRKFNGRFVCIGVSEFRVRGRGIVGYIHDYSGTFHGGSRGRGDKDGITFYYNHE